MTLIEVVEAMAEKAEAPWLGASPTSGRAPGESEGVASESQSKQAETWGKECVAERANGMSHHEDRRRLSSEQGRSGSYAASRGLVKRTGLPRLPRQVSTIFMF